MTRSLACLLLLLLALPGCNRARDRASGAGKPSEKKVDSPDTPRVPIAFTPRTGGLVQAGEVPLSEQINRENVRILAAAMPALVRVTATRQSDPRMELFGRGLTPQFHRNPSGEPTYGSGVIISGDGYIVTNYHVIQDTREVTVQLQDKRSLPARVVASDAPVDVAVLKIDATGLSSLPWGDSDRVQVGEQVFALGNPFNLDESASKGIISGTGRNLPDSGEAVRYENFIQTDAAINPGNSGGALINIHGELIGVNTAIASYTGGNQGVGFAIPSNLVRYAVDGLMKHGRVVTGFLGVKLPESVDPEVGAMLHPGAQQGAQVAGVIAKSPAEKAGLKAGDFITHIDGHAIGSSADLRLVVAQITIGKEVAVDFIRAGAEQSARVTIADPQDFDFAASDIIRKGADILKSSPNGPPASDQNALAGLQVSDLNDDSRQKFGINRLITGGVVISGVEGGSAAESKGLQRGDVIESASINRGETVQMEHAKDFAGLSKTLKMDQGVVLLIHHGRSSSFIYLSPR